MVCCWGGWFTKRIPRGSSSRQSVAHLHASSKHSGGASVRAGQALASATSQDVYPSGPPIDANPLRHEGVEVYCCVCLESFDLLYSNLEFQEQSVAALLDCVRSGRDEGDLGFLKRLLGPEKAQDAVRSVLCGVPYMTVVEFDHSASSCCDKPCVEKVGSGRSSVRTSGLRRSNSRGELQAVGHLRHHLLTSPQDSQHLLQPAGNSGTNTHTSREQQPLKLSGPITLTSPHNSQHQLLEPLGHSGPTSLASRELVPAGRSRPIPLTTPGDDQSLPPTDLLPPPGLKGAAGAPQLTAELPCGAASRECGPQPRPLLVPLQGGDQGASGKCFPVGTAAATAAAAAAAATARAGTSAAAAAAAPIRADAGAGVQPTPPSYTLPFMASSARPSLYCSTFSSSTLPRFSTNTGSSPFAASSRSTPDMDTHTPGNERTASKEFHNRISGDPASPRAMHVTAGSTRHRLGLSVAHTSEGGASLDRTSKCGSPKSGGLKLSSSALSRIRTPAHRLSSGSGFDRTMTMLEVLSSSSSFSTANLRDSMEAPPTAPTNVSPITCTSGHLGQNNSLKELEGEDEGSLGHKETKEDFWPESGLCLGEIEPHVGSKHLGPHDAPYHPRFFGSLDGANKGPHATMAEGPPSAAAPSGSSVHHSHLQHAFSAPEGGINRLEGIVEERTNSTSGSERAAARRSASARAVHSAPPSSSEEAKTEFFEVSLHPLLSGPGRRPMAMMSLANVSEQCQVQDALLSLAEGQLLLLSSFLPQHAIEFLAKQCSAPLTLQPHSLARSHCQVTLMFVDIAGFTSMATRCRPHEVMLLLNTLFSRFDCLTDKFNVHKLETAGDCYVVTAGILSNEERNGFVSTLESHDPAASARHVMEFAKALLEETAKVKMPHSSGEAPVQVRIGIHTGDVVSGLIGSKLPKFSLCGDAMNTASRMESSGQVGRIQVSETTHALLPEYAWQANSITVKGKGAMRSFLWDPEINDG